MNTRASRRETFEEVTLVHLNPLYAAARRLTRGPDEAAGLVEETFLRAYRSFSAVEPGAGAEAWLTAIMESTLSDRQPGGERAPPGGAEPEVRQAPPGLRDRIRLALDAVDGLDALAPAPRPPWLRPLFVVPALVLVLLIAGFRLLDRGEDLPDQVSSDYRELRQDELDLHMLTTRHRTLEDFFAHRGIPFPARVLDLDGLELTLVGGRIHELAGRPTALFVYRGPDGGDFVCERFEGLADELPAGAEVRQQDGVDVRVYRRGRITLAFWDEGSVLSVLSHEGDPERLIQVALAMATDPRGSPR